MNSSSGASGRQSLELLALAKRDQVAVNALGRAADVAFAIVAFHAQQCIEKSMKAVLAKNSITYPRTHDLDELCQLLVASGIDSPASRALLNDITPYAVTARYEVDAEDLVTRSQIDQAVTATILWAISHINPE